MLLLSDLREAESKHTHSDLQLTPLLNHRTDWRHERTTSVHRVAANNRDVQHSEYSLDRSPVHHRTHTLHSYSQTGGQFNLMGGRVHGLWEESGDNPRRQEEERKL